MKNANEIFGRFVLAAAALLLAGAAFGHNITVSAVLLTGWDVGQKTVNVMCDLNWDSSWCDAVNRDAAWVFVKFRPEGSHEWQHASLSAVSGEHTPAADSVIGAVPGGTGVFVYRSGAYTGSVSYTSMKLRWNYGTNGYAFAKGARVEVSVHAIEMVYVPEGAFYLGSTGNEANRFYCPDGTVQTTNAYLVTSEAALEIGPGAGKLWGITGDATPARSTVGPEGYLPAAFPKGYQAFYCMKYELTQGQYTEFLNQLTGLQATNRYPVVTAAQTNRLSVSGSYPSFSAAAPDRACNWLSWADGCAYAAWAGLRPMTELEFEKACRGPSQPVANEYAWGSTAIKPQTGHAGVDGSGTETATAASGVANCNYNNGIAGPVRAGIYATATSTREQAGASYWGIMELTGNLYERCKTVGNDSGRVFIGDHGSGTLTAAGEAANATWVNGMGRRGGGFNSNTTVSDRYLASHADTSRYFPFGFRGVHTAP